MYRVNIFTRNSIEKHLPIQMATKPTPADIFAYLEGYGIDNTCVSDPWLEARIDRRIIPFVEKYTRQVFGGIQTITRSYDGNNTKVLMLDRKPVHEIIRIQIVSVEQYEGDFTKFELEPETGIIRLEGYETHRTFEYVFPRGRRNIRVTYTYGFADFPDDIHEAMVLLTCELVLGHLASLTGGGDLSMQSFSRNFGPRGRYSHIRDEFSRQAKSILASYKSGVI